MIIDVQLMIMDDLGYLESVQAMINRGASVAQATLETGNTFSSAFSAMDDEYMKARAVDVQDVSQRICYVAKWRCVTGYNAPHIRKCEWL